jgi:hypothetical protein
VDRLDSRLNRQMGWRRVALIWLVFCLMAVGLGSSTWALNSISTFADQLPYGRRTYSFVAQWVLIAGAAVFWLVDTRRQQVSRRARADGPNGLHASSAYDDRGLPPPPQGYR